MLALCRKHGAALPAFTEQNGFLTVTFKAQMVQGGGSAADVPTGREAAVEKTVEKTGEKTVEKILNLLRANPRLTQRELAAQTGLSRRGIEWNLKELKQHGRLRRIGPDKGGYWEVPQ